MHLKIANGEIMDPEEEQQIIRIIEAKKKARQKEKDEKGGKIA